MSLSGVPKVKARDPLRAREWNALRGHVIRNATLTGRRGEGDALLGGAAAIWLEIKTLDHANRLLSCVTPGEAGTPGVTEHLVQMPPTFTETNRQGIFYVYDPADLNKRQADGVEDQEINPHYVVGDYLLVLSAANVAEPGDESLRDLNVDGRQWAKV